MNEIGGYLDSKSFRKSERLFNNVKYECRRVKVDLKKFIFLFVFYNIFGRLFRRNNGWKEFFKIKYNAKYRTEREANKTADYTEVYIQEINKTSIIISPYATDPEASYPVYEIYIDEKTKIEEKETVKKNCKKMMILKFG